MQWKFDMQLKWKLFATYTHVGILVLALLISHFFLVWFYKLQIMFCQDNSSTQHSLRNLWGWAQTLASVICLGLLFIKVWWSISLTAIFYRWYASLPWLSDSPWLALHLWDKILRDQISEAIIRLFIFWGLIHAPKLVQLWHTQRLVSVQIRESGWA